MIFGINLSCVKIFDEPDREDFGELVSIPGEKMFMFLGVKDISGVTCVFALGVTGLIAFYVPSDI